MVDGVLITEFSWYSCPSLYPKSSSSRATQVLDGAPLSFPVALEARGEVVAPVGTAWEEHRASKGGTLAERGRAYFLEREERRSMVGRTMRRREMQLE